MNVDSTIMTILTMFLGSQVPFDFFAIFTFFAVNPQAIVDVLRTRIIICMNNNLVFFCSLMQVLFKNKTDFFF